MLVKFLLFQVFPSEPDHSDLPTLPLHASPLQLPPRAPAPQRCRGHARS